jgi:arsenate reductase-like glutaredoxin family protein
LEAKEEVNAKKEKYGEQKALELMADANHLYAAKGKKVVHIDLRKEKPDMETLKKIILGPTGNLRAPTLRKGKTLIIGFNQEMYESVFG